MVIDQKEARAHSVYCDRTNSIGTSNLRHTDMKPNAKVFLPESVGDKDETETALRIEKYSGVYSKS